MDILLEESNEERMREIDHPLFYVSLMVNDREETRMKKKSCLIRGDAEEKCVAADGIRGELGGIG